MKPKTIALFQVSLLALVIALFLWWIYPKEKTMPGDLAVAQSKQATTSHIVFPSIDVEAKSFYVYDVLNHKAIYEKNASLQWPLASLTKLMTVLTASMLVPDYVSVRITPQDLLEDGDSGLIADEEWKLKNLIDYSLIVSSNDGAQAIASIAGSQIAVGTGAAPEKLFVDRMNTIAKNIGLSETYFLNPSGLDVSETLSGGYGSSKDVALLVNYIVEHNPHLLEATALKKTSIASNEIVHVAENTNKSLLNIPNVIASKTGFTDLSGGNLVIAFNAGINRPIIVSLLGSSFDGRFSDMNKLVDATLSYLSNESTTSSSAPF